MILDGHIHIEPGKVNSAELVERLKLAGLDGGILLSLRPQSFNFNGKSGTPEERMTNLLEWTSAYENLYPFFWIDPTEDDAEGQVNLAIRRGVAGFKVICSHFYPSDPHAMKTFKLIAERGKPLLFHSGILWGGSGFSSKYNRPAEFEVLTEINGLKFSLAHISWPWCDELIAVYGKFQSEYTCKSDFSTEMFIDTTPGTPKIYRKDALTKLFTVGYDIEHNIIFGTDCRADDYHSDYARNWIEVDTKIIGEIRLPDDVMQNVHSNNLKRFLGLITERPKRKTLVPDK